jgi:N-acetylmuramoyl-L-alanine amidase
MDGEWRLFVAAPPCHSARSDVAYEDMPNVSAAKRRLLREAVRRNVEIAKGRETRALAQPRRSAHGRSWIALILVILAYVIVPSRLLPFRDVSSATPAARGNTDTVALAAAGARVLDEPASPPQPLDRAVFPLSIRRVVIDPGHGGEDAGAISRSGVTEKDLTLDIGRRLRRLMEQASFEVLMTRDGDDTLSLADRVAFANARRADLFVSVHVNSIPSPDIRPLETFYVGPTRDPHAIRLARLENRHSGYSLADYRQLLDAVYNDARRDESRRLALAVNTALFRSLSPINPLLENRGVKTAPFVVLLGTQMPAILVEPSSVTNNDEVALLTRGEYREQIARGLLRGIRSYASSLDGSDKRGL